jgi:hypothetical protein
LYVSIAPDPGSLNLFDHHILIYRGVHPFFLSSCLYVSYAKASRICSPKRSYNNSEHCV